MATSAHTEREFASVVQGPRRSRRATVLDPTPFGFLAGSLPLTVAAALIFSRAVTAGAGAPSLASALPAVVIGLVVAGFAAVLLGRKRRDAERSWAALRAIADADDDPVVSSDDRGTITYLNAAAERLFGYSPAEAIGAPLDMLFSEPLPEGLRPPIAGAPGRGREIIHVTARRKDGAPVSADVCVGCWKTRGGAFFTAVLGNRHERRQAQEALRLSGERLELALSAAGIGTWTWTPSGAIVWDERMYEISARSPEAGPFSYEEFMRVLHPEDVERVRAALDRALSAGEDYDIDYRVIRPDGSIGHMISRAKVRHDPEGGPLVFTGITLDVSAHKQADALAEQARELARSNAELEQFAYIVSHDLQEPLRTVSSYTQLLARRYRGKLDQNADEFIEFAVSGAARMQRLIRDLLEYSRVSSRVVEPAPTDCALAAREAVENLRGAIEDASAEIVIGDLPVVVGDRPQLVQLFQNLIGNAIKFASERPPKIEISSETTVSHHRFCCRDNGIGIAPEDADRIFAVFQRLHTDSKVPGTGIGLAICKKVVERHGGRMWVESRPGEGATFCFTLPKAPAAPTRLESAAHPPGTDEFQFRSPIPGDAGRQ